MATERRTRNQRRLLVGLLGVATGLAVVLGIIALGAAGEESTSGAALSRPATMPTETARSAPSAATTTEGPIAEATTTESSIAEATTTTEAPVAVDTPSVAASGDPAPSLGSTEACRADPACPSSEHRTSDPCGATLIVDQAGYLEGRHDAERGLPYQIDGTPAPSPEDDDDDDATVGPQTAYRGGYVQGWCDGGGVQPASH
jgi:hypothetical protein